MKTPSKVTSAELAAQMSAWLNENCERRHIHIRQCYDDPGPSHGHPFLDGWICRNCRGEIVPRTVAFSIHNAAFSSACAGFGHVAWLAIPWCPNCEAEPEDSGCIHVAGSHYAVLVAQHRRCRNPVITSEAESG